MTDLSLLASDPAAVLRPRLLVVDDDPGLRELLSGYLEDAGFAVVAVGRGSEMRERLARGERFDLVVLDLMLPGEDGLSLCRDLRSASDIPIVMVTARGDETDRVVGLEMGADDYLAKPFGSRELLARIRTVLRRSRQGSRSPAPTRIPFCGWTLDLGAHHLHDPAGVVVALSAGEFRVLRALAGALDRVLTREQLVDALAGRETSKLDRTIDVLISRLRRRLRDDAREPRVLRTVRGEGYMLRSTPYPAAQPATAFGHPA